MKNRLRRREFLKLGAVAATIPAGLAAGAASNENQSDPTDSIPVREFGKTGLVLPILGFGGAALPAYWGNPLSTEDRIKLVRYAFDRGVRYFDTAGNYMDSQRILGEALKDIRDQVTLVTKVETTDPTQVRSAVERSLSELQTDHLDAILIHGTPGIDRMSVARAMQIHGELVKLREEGITLFIGFSAHSYFHKALPLIKSGGFDLCMLAYGYLPRGYDQVFSARMIELRNACVAKAYELNMGIAAMKVIGAGQLGAWSEDVVPGFDKQHLQQLPGAAIRYVLDDDRVDLLVIGMRLEEEIDANILTLCGDVTYTLEDRALLTEYCVEAFESSAIKQLRIDP